MKTKIYLISALLLLIYAGIKADDNKELKKQISKHLTFPKNYKMHKNECVIYVCFLVNEYGEIEVISTNTDDDIINAYTKDKLSTLKLKKFVPNKIYNYKFVYKKETV